MENENKKKSDILGMLKQLWHDYKNGVFDYETLQIEEYSKKYGVGKVPRSIIAPFLLKRTEPKEEDAERFRLDSNLYRKSKRYPNEEDAKQERLTETEAIEILKRKGYRVMKRTIAYIDI